MAFSRKTRDDAAKAVRTAVSSTDDFFKLWLKNAAQSRLKNATPKKINRVKTFQNGSKFIYKTAVVGNRSMSTVKQVGSVQVPDSQSPLYQMNKTSQLQRRLKPLANTVWAICDLVCIVPYAYFMTITVPNCDLGQLADTQETLWKVANKMNQINQQARRGRVGLTLPAADGTNAHWLGDYCSMETTVNAAKLAANDPHGIYHPHIHVVVVVDKPLDLDTMTTFSHANMTRASATMPSGTAALFQFVLDHVKTNQPLSPDAFKLQKATKRASQSMFDAFTTAMVETTKYAVKPDAWGRLLSASKNPKTAKLALDLFAEIYNAQFGKTLRRNHGVIWKALGFLSWSSSHGLGQAVMAGQYDNQPITANVPDLMTTRAELGRVKTLRVDDDDNLYTTKVDGFIKKVKLNPEQMLYFNDDILGRGGFDSELLNQVQFPDSDNGRLYEKLLKKMRYRDPGKAGIIAQVGAWSSSVKDKNKLSDLNAMHDALDDLLDDDGCVTYTHDWRVRAKLIAAIELLQNAGYNPAVPAWRNKKISDSSRKAEQLALRYFGKPMLGGAWWSSFVSDKVDAIYKLIRRYHIDLDVLTQVLWHSFGCDASGRLTVTDASGRVIFLCHNPNLAAALSEIEKLAVLVCDGKAPKLRPVNYTDSKIDTAEKLQAVVDTIG